MKRGFTIIECLIALAMLSGIFVLMAQLVAWSTQERGRLAARQTALETANNILESARALPFERLTAAWAAEQKLDLEGSALPFDSRLEVVVEAEPTLTSLKRVTVTIRWNTESAVHSREVRLLGVFGPGEAERGKR